MTETIKPRSGMGRLQITRKIGEAVIIGGVVEVIITGRRGDEVQMEILAPREVHIVRKELLSEDAKTN